MDWRLIETAPRDGVTIFGENVKLGQRGMVHWNGWEWEIVDGLNNMPMGIGFCPTHWMPLPPAARAWRSAIPIPAPTGEVEKRYDELIMEVSKKHRNETRHETALRYIRQAEQGSRSTHANAQRVEYQRGYGPGDGDTRAALTDHTTKDDE